MKIIVTTSDNYHHLLPIFFYLYGKYCDEPFELVGYEKPECELPNNYTWVSLGMQGDKSEWSTDLRRYFEQQPDHFVWMMEDTFIKSEVGYFSYFNAGRIDLTGDVQKRENTNDGYIVTASPFSRYRLSTQPSIWNREFLLKYLKDGLNPWDFETQDPKNDGWEIFGYLNPPIKHNEGVRRFDIYKLNLDGMCQEDIDYINSIATWQTK